MEKQNLYVLTLAVLSVVSVAVMAALDFGTLDIYVSGLVLVYFVCSTVFQPRRRTVDFVAVALLLVFAYVVALRVLAILVL
jgi:hypothetical protein